MPDSNQIYQNFADRYHALVAREDYENNLLPAINEIVPLQNKVIVELGAGTGRVSLLLAPLVQCLFVGDRSHHMLSYGGEILSGLGLDNWHPFLESHQALPLVDHRADMVIAGWSFCHIGSEAGEAWEAALEKGLSEVARVLKPGGVVIIIETLGTGFQSPHPPARLQKYLAYLDSHGFQSDWIRTDYCFKDVAEAKDLTTFFFGEDPLPMWEVDGGAVVPECTGLWWKAIQ